MPDRPLDVRDVNPARVGLDPLLREISELLAYLDLHLGRYPWQQLTTRQKELLADLIDSSHVLADDANDEIEPWFVARWWRDDWVQPDPQDQNYSEPDPFTGRRPKRLTYREPNRVALALAAAATSAATSGVACLEEQVAVYEWALSRARPTDEALGLTSETVVFPSAEEANAFLAEYRKSRGR